MYCSSRRIFALLLAVLLTLGMSLSVAHAGHMSVQMAMASAASAFGQGGCDHCNGGGDSTNTLACPSMLYCSSPAVLLADGGVAVATTSELLVPVIALARSLITPPDPYPPKLVNLG